jgi:hypothetical protein
MSWARARERLHRFALEHRVVAIDHVEDAGRQHEKAAVDPRAVGRRLLMEGVHLAVRDLERAEAGRRAHGGDRRQPPVGAVEPDQVLDVDLRDAVAIGHAEGLVAEIVAQAPQPAAGLSLQASVHQRHAPGLRAADMGRDIVLRIVEGHVGHVQPVVREELLDHVALVAERENELVDAALGVDLHDVPEDRAPSDLDHRLRARLGLLHEPCA